MRHARLLLGGFTAAAIGVAAALGGCGKKDTASMLSYVPADSPYVFANIEPMPKAYIDGVAAKFGPLAQVYEQMIDDALAALANEPKDTPNKVVTAILSELKGKISLAGMESLGFSPQMHTAIYGVGLAPVMRVELKDPAAFKAFLGRVEQRAGEAVPTAKIGDDTYWRFGKPGTPLVPLAIIQGNQLVVSIIPADATVGLVKQLFGVVKPAKSVADTGALTALNKQYGFTPNGSGYLDVVRFAQVLLDAKSGVEQEYVKALGGKNDAATAECRAETLAIAGSFPRLVVGYEKLEATSASMRMVVETKPELAKSMAGMVAPVPGLGGASDALVDFGASFNITKVLDFAGEKARAVAAAPYKCAELASLNQSFAKLQQDLQNPMAYAAAPMLKGFRVALSKYDMPAGGMPTVAGKVVVASDNPAALISLAQTNVPQLAALKLVPNSPPVALPAGLVPPGVPQAYVAYTDKALGLAVGEGEQAALPQFIGAPASDPSPFLVVGYGGKFFELMSANMAAAVAKAPPEQRQKLQRQMQLMQELYGKVLKRTEMSLLLTDRGIELKQSVQLN